MDSRPATCLLVFPWAINSRTCCSGCLILFQRRIRGSRAKQVDDLVGNQAGDIRGALPDGLDAAKRSW